jgi:uncharacterized protein YxjI
MAIAVACGCGANFDLKDEYAGRRLACPKCGGVLQAPAAAAIPVPEGDPAFARDKFLLRQKRISISEKYYVWDENQRNILYIERPIRFFRSLLAVVAGFVAAAVVAGGFIAVALTFRDEQTKVILMIAGAVLGFAALLVVAVTLAPLRHVMAYRDDTRAEKLFDILQVNRWQLPIARYRVADGEGNELARLSKNYLWNIVRRRWHLWNPDGSLLGVAKEDSMILSLMRRILPPIIAVFMRTNFIILAGPSDRVIGEFNRKLTLFDRYVLDMSADREHLIDRRVAVALGVMLDTGEKR